MKKEKRTSIRAGLVAVLALVLCAAMMLPACNKKNQGGADKGGDKAGKKIIGVSLLKESDDFYKVLKTGIQETAEKMGYEVEILSADGDEMKQSNNIDALLTKNVAAIVICPVNSEGVGTIIQKATDKNIPVFTADIAAKKGAVVAHIASDNYSGGKLAAQKIFSLIGAGGKVAIVQQPGTESVAARVKGFTDEAAKDGLVISQPLLNGKDDTQESERAVNATLLSNPDIKGVFAANDSMAGGAEAAINASGKQIVLVGYDASPAAQGKIKQGGVWKADVQQNPKDIGRMTVETIDSYLNGKLAKSDKTTIVPVPVGLYEGK